MAGPQEPDLRPGRTIAGKYVIEEILGEGGMGIVLAARHVQLEERVAIKVMRPQVSQDRTAAERFLREARAAAKVRNEHVGRVYDVGDEDGLPFIVMEYLEGRSLGKIIETNGQTSAATAAAYMLQVCDGIAEAHRKGIVHRDLKPDNIFVTTRADGKPIIKVLDFGISKSTPVQAATTASTTPQKADRMTHTTAVIGSPLYMSPEQLATPREVDVRTDIWSIGVVLYELLAGVPPFVGETLLELLIQIREKQPRSLRDICPDVPAELVAIVERCLQKQREYRWSTTAELAEALAPFAPPDPRSASGRHPVFEAPPPEEDAIAVAPPRVSGLQAGIVATFVFLALVTALVVVAMRRAPPASAHTGEAASATTSVAPPASIPPPPPPEPEPEPPNIAASMTTPAMSSPRAPAPAPTARAPKRPPALPAPPDDRK
jgi:serine/threonine-protein kinase